MLHATAHNRGSEGGGRHIALALCDKLLSQDLKILDAGELLIEVGICPEHIDGPGHLFEVMTLLMRHLNSCLYLFCQQLAKLVERRQQSLEHRHLGLVAFFAVVQEPRAFLGGRHIRELGNAVVVVEMSEGVAVATVGRHRLVFELREVYEFRLVDQDVIEGLGVRRSLPVLRDDGGIGTGIEGDGILPVHGLDDRLLPSPSLSRFLAPCIVYALDESPASEVCIPAGDDIRPHAF